MAQLNFSSKIHQDEQKDHEGNQNKWPDKNKVGISNLEGPYHEASHDTPAS